jgi:hypothetical protein
VEEFHTSSVPLAGGEVTAMKLAERGSRLANGLWVREVRKLSETGRQTSILSTNYRADYTALAVSMFARWSQENFYKYMRQHYNLDRLAEYGTEPIPDSIQAVNPAWRQLDSQIRAKTATRRRQLALFGAWELQSSLAEPEVARYQQKKAQLQEEMDNLNREIDELKKQRKETPHHIPVKDLPESDRFSRLLTERKHFIDTIKLIAYRAETSMASLLRDKLNREDDTRALLRQIYETDIDLVPDLETNTQRATAPSHAGRTRTPAIMPSTAAPLPGTRSTHGVSFRAGGQLPAEVRNQTGPSRPGTRRVVRRNFWVLPASALFKPRVIELRASAASLGGPSVTMRTRKANARRGSVPGCFQSSVRPENLPTVGSVLQRVERRPK